MSFYNCSNLLINIISQLQIPLVYKNIKINILDHLSCVKKGYFLTHKELNSLFRICNLFKNNDHLFNKIPKCKTLDHFEIIVFNSKLENPINLNDLNDLNKTIELSRENDIIIDLESIIFNKFDSKVPDIYQILTFCIKNNKKKLITKSNNF